jgi:hypothetical protein
MLSDIFQSVLPQNFHQPYYQSFNAIKGSKKQIELFNINYCIA